MSDKTTTVTSSTRRLITSYTIPPPIHMTRAHQGKREREKERERERERERE